MPTTNGTLFPCFPREPVNDQLCYFCLEAEDDIIYCDGYCQKSYCRDCLGLQTVPVGDFFCPYCSRNLLRCDVCEKPGAYNLEVFRCFICSYASHPDCAEPIPESGFFPVYLRDHYGIRRREWMCKGCATNEPRCFRCCTTHGFVMQIDKVSFCAECWGENGTDALKCAEWGK